jgi:hypothetical protein
MNTETALPISLHWGNDGMEIVTDPKRAKELYKRNRRMVWGADGLGKDDTLDVGGQSAAENRTLYHPGRDYQFRGSASAARVEAQALRGLGVPLRSDLFRGATGFDDLATLWEISDGTHALSRSKGFGGKWLLDNAPTLYIAQETIRQTGEIQNEEYVQLSARDLLPSVVYNTWLETYRYDRIAEKLTGIAMPANMSGKTERGVVQSGDVDRVPIYKPLMWFESGASWEWFELEIIAEMRANGAPDLDVINRRMRLATLMQELTYNVVSLFGWTQLGLTGVLNAPELAGASYTVAAAQELGANGDPAEDLAIFVTNWLAMIDGSIRTSKPDTIALGTRAWSYINTTMFKSVDTDSTRTLASIIMEQLAPLGLKDILWIPEMEYSQDQADAWENEMGFSEALSETWAGGLNGENVMLMFRRSPESGKMVIGKPIGQRPQFTVEDRTTVRLVQSLGSFDVRRPVDFRIVTGIGPYVAP